MNMKNITRRLFCALLVLAMLVSCIGTSFAANPLAETEGVVKVTRTIDANGDQVAGIWIWASTIANSSNAQAMIEGYANAGITDIYLLVKGTGGQLAWDSDVANATVSSSSGTALETCMKYAQPLGVRVHAWMMLYQDDAYVSKTGIAGTDAMLWYFNGSSYSSSQINLRNKNYMNYVADLCEELVELGVDGIHLDGIRYKTIYADWGLYARQIMMNDYGMTLDQYNGAVVALCKDMGFSYSTASGGHYQYSSGSAYSGSTGAFANYVNGTAGTSTQQKGAQIAYQYRCDTVNNFVKLIDETIGDKAILSCATSPEITSTYGCATYGQNAETMAPYVDYIAIMAYAPEFYGSSTWPASQSEKIAAQGCNVIAGLQAYDDTSIHSSNYTNATKINAEVDAVLSKMASVNDSSSYSADILGYAFFRAPNMSFAKAKYNAADSTVDVYVNNFTGSTVTKMVFTTKGSLKIDTSRGTNGIISSSNFSVSSSSSTSITSTTNLSTYEEATFKLAVTGTYDETLGALNLATYTGSYTLAKSNCINYGETHTHEYTSAVTTPATCTTAGVLTYTCSCGDSYTEAIPAGSHNYTSVVTTPASCTSTGVATLTCSSCGDSKTQTIPVTGHNYSGVTNEETGVTTYTCSDCGYSYDSDCGKVHCGIETWTNDDGTHHAFCFECNVSVDTTCVFEEVERVEPTCTTEGYVIYQCVGGKNPTSGETDVDVYSTTGGCGYSYKETLPVSHNYTYVNNTNGTHSATCACGASTTEAHSFSEDGICACGSKEAKYIFFDFTQSDADKERYSGSVYSGTDMDDTSNWALNKMENTSVANGELTATVNGENSYLRTSIGGTFNLQDLPLQYVPGEEDLLQIRFKITGSSATAIGVKPYYYADGNPDWTTDLGGAHVELGDGEYQVVTIPLKESSFVTEKLVRGIQISFFGLTDGELAVDYIYIGSKEDYPKENLHFVEFLTEEGNAVIATELSDNGKVAYTKETPYKEANSFYHYVFKGWNDANGNLVDLNTLNVTEDMKLYAYFEEQTHSLIISEVTDDAGNKMSVHICTGCDFTLFGGHSWDEGEVTTEPTCDTEGTLSHTCTICGETCTESIPAIAHANTTTTTVDATCTATGTVTVSCVDCGAVISTETVAATGHSSSYVDNGDGTHDYICSVCNTVEIDNEAHTYTDGSCACGAEEVTGPTLDTNLKFYAKSLALESYIAVNFTILNSTVKNYDSYYVEFVHESEDGTKTTTDTGAVLVENVATYFELQMCAKEMADKIYVTLYAQKDGVLYCGETVEYSIMQSAMDNLAKIGTANYASKASTVTMYVDMLNYGAAAQTHFKYNTANLANSQLTLAERKYATTGELTVEDNSAVTSSGYNSISFVRNSLGVDSRIEMQFTVNIGSCDINDLICRIDYNGQTYFVMGSEMTHLVSSYYTVILDEIPAKDVRASVAVTFYSTGRQKLAETMTYSIEDYVASRLTDSSASVTLIDLLTAMMRYGDACSENFG